jgi:hypothetical protein
MVADHLLHVGLLAWGWPVGLVWVRLSLTRLALPLFMGVSGFLWMERSRGSSRLWLVAIAALVSAVLCKLLGMAAPDVLLPYLLVALARRWVLGYPVVVLVLGILQAVNLPMGVGAYELGYVAAWCAVGVLAWTWYGAGDWYGSGDLSAWDAGTSWWARGLCVVGRWPLTWYVGHLAALVLVLLASRALGIRHR